MLKTKNTILTGIIACSLLFHLGCDQGPLSSSELNSNANIKQAPKVEVKVNKPDEAGLEPPLFDSPLDDELPGILLPIDSGGSQGALQDARTGNPDQNVRGSSPDGECGNGEQEALPSKRTDCPFLLYGSSIGDNGDSILWHLNESSGTGSLIKPIANIEMVSGLDFSPDGQLYAVGVDGDNNSVLAKMDCLSGVAEIIDRTFIENLPPDETEKTITDINFDAQGQLWAHVKISGSLGGQVGTLNIATGLFTAKLNQTGLSGEEGHGLAFSPFPGPQTLFHADESELATIDQVDGTGSGFGSIHYPEIIDFHSLINAMDLDPFSNILYVSIRYVETYSISQYFLGTINTSNKTVTFIQSNKQAPAGLDALAVNRRYEECDINSIECKDCELHEKNCEDGEDNDFDGLTDCADEDCLDQSCNDGSVCTINDTCKSVGAEGCDGDNPCEDNNECTNDSCVPETTCQEDDCHTEPTCAHSLDENKTNWGDCTADPTGDPNYDENIPDSAICFVGRCEQPPNEAPQCVTKNLNEIAISETVHSEAHGCLDDDPCTADSCIPIRVPDEENSGESITRPFCEYQTMLGVQCDHDENLCTIETCQKSNVEDNGGADNAAIQVSANGAASLGISCEPSRMLNGPKGEQCQITGTGAPLGKCSSGQKICREGVQSESCAQVIFPIEEICHNGLDDNCDGVVDEGCPRLVFVTMGKFSSGKGIEPAHNLCKQEAINAGKPGTFKAWISHSMSSPSTTFSQPSDPYVLADVTGIIVADNWADLTDGGLDNPIDKHADGSQAPSCDTCGNDRNIWTGTKIDGTVDSTNTCLDWTSTNSVPTGTIGHNYGVDSSWTEGTQYGCHQSAAVFCFEQ